MTARGRRLDALIHEAALKSPEALPLLEFTLDELYKRRTGDDLLTFAAYEQLGGLEGALAQRAEAVFSSLDPKLQKEFPDLIRALITIQTGAEELVVGRRAPMANIATSPRAQGPGRGFG